MTVPPAMQTPYMPASALSLRDFFATAALAAAMGLEGSADDVAEYAYAVADAMLRARMNPAMLRARMNPPSPWPALHADTEPSKE